MKPERPDIFTGTVVPFTGTRTRAALTVLVLSILLLPLPPAVAAPPPAPRLVVILVVDQMRADYVDRFGPHWTGGLRRLLDEGAWFREAAYPYMTTVTCVGHSTIVTGSLPRTHGIVANQWWDRASAAPVKCESDTNESLVSYGAPVKGGTSARNLMVPALPDELRLQSAAAPRIVTASIKSYTATMMAGRMADAAVWFDVGAHALVTSSAFAREPVPFVARFVKTHPIEAGAASDWRKLLPESEYQYTDDGPGEKPPAPWTNRFPHAFRGTGGPTGDDFYSRWVESPFSDAYLGQFAEAALDELKLGQGRGTDYLAISFSALDEVGHYFGPRSHEVQDVLVRLDRTLGSLLAHLDRSVGRGRYVVALTADHGVSPIPEQVASFGLPAGRIPAADLTARLEKALEPALGPGRKVARLISGNVYFEPGIFAKLQASPEVMNAAISSLQSAPGVLRVLRSDDLTRSSAGAGDRIVRAAAAGFFPGRSGDLIIVPRPYWVLGSADPTSHGSPWAYDQRVPLALYGQGIRRGQYFGASAPVDIAPTLAFLCGVTLPAPDGRILSEALLPTPAPVAAGAAPVRR
jgi:arylsulfatase A-like enzyme